MIPLRLLPATAFAMALAACTLPLPHAQSTPPPATAPSAAAAPSTAGSTGSNSGGTYPYGSTTAVQTSDAETAPDSGTVVGPGGAIWLKPGTPNARYQNDADDCHSYAMAQVNHDARIESDADAAFGERSGSFASLTLRQQMSQYGREKSVPRLFGQCMEAKGYTRG